MGLRISQNVAAMNAYRNLTVTAGQMSISGVPTADRALSDVHSILQRIRDHLSVAAENLSASQSRIRDADMASELVALTRSQILTQPDTAMLAQANQAPRPVLQLLRS